MGRTIVTPAKKKLVKDELKKKNQEIHERKVHRISTEIEVCNNLDTWYSRWVKACVESIPGRVLKSLIRTIVLWLAALCGTTGARPGTEEKEQKEIEIQINKPKSKIKRARPKKKSPQNAVVTADGVDKKSRNEQSPQSTTSASASASATAIATTITISAEMQSDIDIVSTVMFCVHFKPPVDCVKSSTQFTVILWKLEHSMLTFCDSRSPGRQSRIKGKRGVNVTNKSVYHQLQFNTLPWQARLNKTYHHDSQIVGLVKRQK